MVWDDVESGGFTEPGVEPWLPVGPTDRNVAGQRDYPASTLNLTRDLIALRRHRGILHGAYEPVDGAPAGVWAFRRGGGALVAVNLGDDRARMQLDGAIVIGTDRGRDGQRVDGTLELRPREAVIAST
jgi:alpha-glucosidase